MLAGHENSSTGPVHCFSVNHFRSSIRSKFKTIQSKAHQLNPETLKSTIL